jgi:hypothetical protein
MPKLSQFMGLIILTTVKGIDVTWGRGKEQIPPYFFLPKKMFLLTTELKKGHI